MLQPKKNPLIDEPLIAASAGNIQTRKDNLLGFTRNYQCDIANLVVAIKVIWRTSIYRGLVEA